MIDIKDATPAQLLHDYFRQFRDFYNYCLTFQDKRVAEWPLMSSPMYTIYLCVAYLLFVAIVPQIMAKRQAIESRMTLIVYNFAMVLLNVYIFVELLVCALKSDYNWICTPVDYSDNPLAIRIAAGLWWYYLSKPIEFFDTIMFILRKKNRQVTFLHVYHHVTMPLLWWIGIKFVAGGQSLFPAMINASVHVIMYTYYGLAAVGPEMQKYLWWKKHITKYQLLQFVYGMMHAAGSLYTECDFPSWMQYALIAYAGSFFILFSNFYIGAYLSKPEKRNQNGGVKEE